MVNVDGSSYTGQFKDDFMDGLGTYQHADGAKYAGYWKNDQHHGTG